VQVDLPDSPDGWTIGTLISVVELSTERPAEVGTFAARHLRKRQSEKTLGMNDTIY
jgi:hypothetical protein